MMQIFENKVLNGRELGLGRLVDTIVNLNIFPLIYVVVRWYNLRTGVRGMSFRVGLIAPSMIPEL